MLDELREGGYNLERFQLICNRIGRESAHLQVEHVETTLKRPIAHQIPDDWKSVSSAINMGSPLIESAPKSRARAAIRELAERIANPEAVADESNSGKGKFWGRIFSGAS